MKVSENISFKEATRSNTAVRLGINNSPDWPELENMKTIAREIFQPLREAAGGPIRINSFFRSEELNKKVGGSRRSQHIKGQAMDLDDTFEFMTNAEMFDYIKNNLSFDQLIWEFGSSLNPDWVHVSYVSKDKNRGMCLRALVKDGKIKYEKF